MTLKQVIPEVYQGKLENISTRWIQLHQSFVIKSLPLRFDHFKLTYNIQEHKWSLEDLTSLWTQERLQLFEVKFWKCKFCFYLQIKEKEARKDRIRWVLSKRTRKGKIKIKHWLVSIAKNLVISRRTVQNIMVWDKRNDCLHCHKPISEEKYVFPDIDTLVRVERYEIFRLLLDIGHFIYLIDTFVVPTFKRNLVFVSTLDKFGYTCTFGKRKVSIKYEDNIIGTGSLSHNNNLYLLNIVASSNLVLHTTMKGSKLYSLSSNSYSLWHRRLGHVSKKRIDRLIVEGILQSFDVGDIEKCVSCIKGKNTHTTGKVFSRATELIQLIHTDTCGPFSTAIRNGHRYFITFTDDYLRYGYIYLIHDKSESLDTFKIFKAEVENQLNKRIKHVWSDRGGEWYGRNDAFGEQCRGNFSWYLKKS